MVRIVGLLSIAVALAVILLALLGGCSTRQQPQTQDEKAQDIYRSLMCPICSGQTIEQSQSPLSVQMRALVKEKLEQGWTKEQILQFFVDRYGDVVLAAPAKKGFNLIAWLTPIIGIIIGGIVTWLAIRQWYRRGRKKESLQAPVAAASKGVVDDKYLSRLEKELKNFDNRTGFR